jgi:outer membrane protein
MNKTVFLALALLLACSAGAQAQKFGYCSSDALLAELPEVKAADSELQAFQTQLTKRGQERVKALQTQAAELERKKEEGTISPNDYQTQNAKLEEEQGSIAKYEQEVYEKISKKREQLYKPLLEKVDNAMKAVATKNGFMFVFDASSNVLVYADESLDVTALVKAELGVKN